jgi:hypothetical protein
MIPRGWLRVTRLALILASILLSTGRAQATRTEPMWAPGVGLHLGTPAIASLAAGIILALPRESTGAPLSFFFALAEPGIRAGRASVGFGRLVGQIPSGFTLRATGLRVWHETPANYLGGEISALIGSGPRVGLFRRIGPDGPRRLRVTVDFSILL